MLNKLTTDITRLCTFAYVHLAGFTPAFTLSFHDNECSLKQPNANNLIS